MFPCGLGVTDRVGSRAVHAGCRSRRLCCNIPMPPSIILFWLGSPHAQHLASTPLDILIIVGVLGRYLVTYRVHALRLEMMHWREEAFRLRANSDKSHED
jgi:hypothetical protein